MEVNFRFPYWAGDAIPMGFVYDGNGPTSPVYALMTGSIGHGHVIGCDATSP